MHVFQGNYYKDLHAPKTHSTKSMEEATVKCYVLTVKLGKSWFVQGLTLRTICTTDSSLE